MKIEKENWRKYFEKLEELRTARERLDKKEITEEEFIKVYSETAKLMQELGE